MMKTILNYLKSRFMFGYALGIVNSMADMSLLGSSLAPNEGASIVSAASITINRAIHPLTGTTQITTIKVPTGFRGVFGFIPAAAANGATGGTYVASDGTVETIPFALGWVGAANKLALFYCDGLKIYPLVLTAAG